MKGAKILASIVILAAILIAPSYAQEITDAPAPLIYDLLPGHISLKLASIIGPSEMVDPGASVSYEINIDTGSNKDTDYSDGTYEARQATWVFIDSDDNILEQGDWQEIDRYYIETVSLTAPLTPGEYAIVGMVIQDEATYSNGVWSWGEWDVINKEISNLCVGVPIPPPPVPPVLAEVFGKILDWLSGYF